MDPRGKTVIITGASSGIGAATARAFAEAGADVVLAARSAAPLEQLAATLPGHPLVLPTDISQPAQAHALVARTAAARGRVDILINNAGVGLTGQVAHLPAAALRASLEINLFGALATIQAAVPYMRRQGRGQIINISSVLAAQPMPRVGGYAAAKAALESLSATLRTELLPHHIAVTVVRPGTTRTAFFERRMGSDRQRWRPRGVPPETVARALLRAARHEPRIAYVTLGDRVQLWVAALVPGLIDRLLAWAPLWEDAHRD